MTNESIHRQVWANHTKIVRSGTEGSINLEIYPTPQGFHSVEAYICNLMVEVEHRHKGIGRELMDWAEDKARAEGYEKVFLSWSANESAQSTYEWYERRGYKQVAFGPNGCLMMKEL